MAPRWQSLPTRSKSAPPLLYSFNYTSQFYEFRLTDLTYMWSERLDHKHILLKAEDSETSIDPSEDANQYAVFMQKIQDALHGAKSSIVKVAADGKPGSLTVTTSTSLPGGLRPLEWSFSLSRDRPTAVTRELLLPLLKGEKEREKREQSLLDHLRDKDNVLSKIFDKIDASQLTSMFPGTAGVRHAKPKTSDLIKHIKGATKFDEKEWRENFEYEDTVVSDVENLAESVSKFTRSTVSDIWWENLEDDELASKPPRRLPEAETRKKDYPSASDTGIGLQKDLEEDKSTEDEDEFQRQETPPHLKRKKEEVVTKQADKNVPDDVAGTTESDQADESTDEQEIMPKLGQKSKPAPKKAVGRIGGPKVALGRPRKVSASLSTDSDSTSMLPKSKQRIEATQKMPELNDDSSMSSDSQSESVGASRSVSLGAKKDKSAVTTTSSKQKGVLGRIGGKKLELQRPVQSTSTEGLDHDVDTQSSSENDDKRHRTSKPHPTPKKAKKLGLIGGGKKKPQADVTTSPGHESDDDDLNAGPSRKATKGLKLPSSPSPPLPPPSKSPSPIQQRRAPKPEPEPEPEPELSAEQKANRKREELKRQLDARSKAPAKKKRKF